VVCVLYQKKILLKRKSKDIKQSCKQHLVNLSIYSAPTHRVATSATSDDIHRCRPYALAAVV